MNKYILGTLAIIFLVVVGFKSSGSSMKENEQENKSIVRAKTVKVASLDLNKDKKVFQCTMKEHYNVISDKAGICPLCKMDLLEISVSRAQKNLDSMSPDTQKKHNMSKMKNK